ILSRVVIASDEEFMNGRRLSQVVAYGVRGWRNFVAPPMAYAEVEVQVGDLRTTVRTDRMGVVDVVLDVELEPGWQTATLHVGGQEERAVMDLYICEPGARVGL
ncbi:ACP synthase, partial [Nocardia farcinica]|nr:ACP synthase [Nocardia farcinica]